MFSAPISWSTTFAKSIEGIFVAAKSAIGQTSFPHYYICCSFSVFCVALRLIASFLNSCYLSFSSIALTLLVSFQYSSLFYIVLMHFFSFLYFPLLNDKYAPKTFLIFSLSFFSKFLYLFFILPSSLNIPLFFHFAE